MKLFLAVAFSLFSITAVAEGKLSYSLKFDKSFMRLDAVEKDGVREGEVNFTGARAYLTSFVRDDRFYLPLAQFTNDSMEIKAFSEKHTRYRGLLYQDMITTVDVYKDLKKGTLRMIGTIGTYTQFEYTTHINKKGKRHALFNWSDSCRTCVDGLMLEIFFAPDDGSCTGSIRSPMDEIAKFTCRSEGKLKDAFYYNEMDILAFIVHVFIAPE